MPRLKIVTGCLTTVVGYDPAEEFYALMDGKDFTPEEMIRLSERLVRLGPEKGFEVVGGPLTPEKIEERAGPDGTGECRIQILNRTEEEARTCAKRIRDLIFFRDF